MDIKSITTYTDTVTWHISMYFYLRKYVRIVTQKYVGC